MHCNSDFQHVRCEVKESTVDFIIRTHKLDDKLFNNSLLNGFQKTEIFRGLPNY